MPLVLGLGNPGGRYARTRHNVGWRTIESLVSRWRARTAEETPRYRTWNAEVAGRGVDLMIPLTYMNASGEALAEWRGRRELPEGSLLVVADDVYLPEGFIRLRERGSSGGHRGLESIEEALGSREYARLRIGIGAVPSAVLREHVLETPALGEEEEALERGIALAVEAVECWIGEGMIAAMNRFNRRVRKEVSEP
jgi:PTH1 family peptidyl-tRNA hydrolase